MKKGFTFIEFLAFLVIVAAVAYITIPYFMSLNKEQPAENNVVDNSSEDKPTDNKEDKQNNKQEEKQEKKEEKKQEEKKQEDKQDNNQNTNTKYIVDATRSSDSKYNGGFIMPDIYNTGYTSSFNDLVDFKVKYPEVSGCTITAKNAAKYNYTFEGFKANCQITIRAVDNITLKNFYINSDSWYGINIVAYNNEKYPTNTTITDGEIVGTKSAGINGKNVTIKRMYIHNYGGDALKFGSNQIIESNYIGSGGTNEGAHADGIQLMGTTNNSVVRGNRFDMVAIPNGNYKANATVFIKLESGSSDGVTVTNNWLNGGGYTTYIIQKQEVAGNITNLTYAKNKIGNGYRYGRITRDKTISVKGLDTQIYMDEINVPSIGSIVYYDQNGKRVYNLNNVDSNMKILVNSANYTPNDLTIKVVSTIYDKNKKVVDSYTTTNTIHKNITGKESVNNSKLTLDSFPFNVPTTITINNLPTLSKGYSITTKAYIDNYEIRSDTISKN